MKFFLICSAFLIAVSFSTSDAWLFNSGWQTKRCFCKVYHATTNVLLHDLQAIYRCKELLGCGCNHAKMLSCYPNCEDAVRVWGQTNCPPHLRGTPIKAHFKASTCQEGFTETTFTCTNNNSGSQSGSGGIANSGVVGDIMQRPHIQ